MVDQFQIKKYPCLFSRSRWKKDTGKKVTRKPLSDRGSNPPKRLSWQGTLAGQKDGWQGYRTKATDPAGGETKLRIELELGWNRLLLLHCPRKMTFHNL